MDQKDTPILFALFAEANIVAQLSRAIVEARLPSGMTAAQFGVLNHLLRIGHGTTPIEIARAFQTPKTSMTHSLAGLVKLGYIEMRPNPKDGRSKRVWITEPGRVFRQEIIAAMAPDVARVSAHLSVETLGPLVAGLAEIRGIMDENRPDMN